jgi:hypothetical protein
MLTNDWRKSSKSGHDGQCVEVRKTVIGKVAVRHSKNPNGEFLIFTPEEWDAFQAGVILGEFKL